jgi:hypothetical protein
LPGVDKGCTTHHICDCLKERLDKIEEVWIKYKHLDDLLIDEQLVDEEDLKHYILLNLWRAIRVNEK